MTLAAEPEPPEWEILPDTGRSQRSAGPVLAVLPAEAEPGAFGMRAGASMRGAR